ncbi:unnamed protein product [Effrenium voratum]|uniref:Uncharacterized protein n=1 Tax=Effrenium voratum TaxID=2562239 RepID=A0AA36NB99_9DINO|nr:unnamed protein product [Effrenium voratum]
MVLKLLLLLAVVHGGVVELKSGPLASHTCARDDSGQVKCWGANTGGKLGTGNTASYGDSAGEMGANLPAVDLGTGRTAVAISLGQDHTCALLDNGSMKCWGDNSQGQLGYGDTTSRGSNSAHMGDNLAAIDLGDGRTATAIATGQYHTCAILDDWSTKCWGYNDNGQLGLGHTNNIGDGAAEMGNSLAAVNLGTGRFAKKISAGAGITCVVLLDDTALCWGKNNGGQLGQDSTTNMGSTSGNSVDSMSTINLGSGRTAKIVAPGEFHVCALLDDDTVKCWGSSSYGQLGQGDTSSWGTSSGSNGMANLPAVELGQSASVVDASAKQLLQQLDVGEPMMQLEQQTPDGAVTVAAFMAPKNATVATVTAGDAAVEVPAQLLQQASALAAGGPVLLSLASSQGLAEKMSVAKDVSGVEATLASVPLVIDLRDAQGRKLKLGRLEKPMLLELPVGNITGSTCAYWDEEKAAWAYDGLEDMPGREDGAAICLTHHLSIFAMIVKDDVTAALACSTASQLLTQEAVRNLARTERYAPAPSFVFLGGILLAAVGMGFAWRWDRKADARVSWATREALLLHQEHEVPKEETNVRLGCLGKCADCVLKFLGFAFEVKGLNLVDLTRQCAHAPTAAINYSLQAIHARRAGLAKESMRAMMKSQNNKVSVSKSRSSTNPEDRQSALTSLRESASRVGRSVRQSAVSLFTAARHSMMGTDAVVESFKDAHDIHRVMASQPSTTFCRLPGAAGWYCCFQVFIPG